MFDFFERGFLATVGLFSMSREKSQELVDDLVQRGQLNRDEGKQLVERMVRRGEEEQKNLRDLVRQEVQQVLQELDIVTQKDMDALNAKLDTLIQKLDRSG